MHHIMEIPCLENTIFVSLVAAGSTESSLYAGYTGLWVAQEFINSKHIPLSLCDGKTVAADGGHGDAEPGLFQHRIVRSKHHRYIKTAPFTDQYTCSKTEGNGVILEVQYLLLSVRDRKHSFHLIGSIFSTTKPCLLNSPPNSCTLQLWAEQCTLDRSELFIVL